MSLSLFYRRLVGLLLCGAVILFCISWYVANQTAALTTMLDERISATYEIMVTIAVAAEGSGSFDQQVISDCPAPTRERFDLLLGQLATLPVTELGELQSLFESCGDFPALEKAVLVSQLDREYRALREYVSLRTLVDGRSVVSYPLETWVELINLERDRSQLFTRLVSIQRELLAGRIQGWVVNDPKTTTLLEEAQLVRDGIVAVSSRARELHIELGIQ